ncbi:MULTISPECIES: DUF4926 domain-containing protein [unclassified Imperialibacter]|uniref:DUF4926 domain-containing protein n=1 Tax=unclassified Imperialibacter TaxID=2629706 RepID=UPI00125A976F|nr:MULTISPECIES: DUF4926 domain-containing protein [unclassified Imperialibacter]CAD5253723.1 conserved hypothetical protein [Imperialibacter sp. 89]CAD5275420.1 conserved hypothetical protein [Imperialibacter sp. 75]VVT19743.1 conserved hypothetical protein [Imperialibacter sp. EC-SDR9]
MIENFDRVVLKEDLPERGLVKGDIGTVVMIHDNRKGYEVEFFTLMGKTRSVETLKGNQVRSVKANEVAHSREIA